MSPYQPLPPYQAYAPQLGQPVQGASSSVTAGAAGAPQTASIAAIVREFGCACDASSQIRFELSGADSMVSGAAVSVVKL